MMSFKSADDSISRKMPGFCLLLVFLLVAAATAFAHDPGLSAVSLQLESDRVDAHLTFARADIETLIQDPSQQPELLNAIAAELIEMRAGDRVITGNLKGIEFDKSDGVHFRLSFPLPGSEIFIIESKLIHRLARGHRQYLELFNGDGKLAGSKLLETGSNSYRIDPSAIRAGEDRPQSFAQFLFLGVEHILTGFDHLAFLFALLIVGGTLREAAKIITSFTVAHSMTLALATFNIVSLPSNIIEPIIALSIVYVGIENIFRKEIKMRWLLTFGFGLIHGFGFASVLRELGIGESGNPIMPLLSFNLGVELGQIAIAALALPLIWKLKRMDSFALRFAPACSILIAIAGGYWLIERTII